MSGHRRRIKPIWETVLIRQKPCKISKDVLDDIVSSRTCPYEVTVRKHGDVTVYDVGIQGESIVYTTDRTRRFMFTLWKTTIIVGENLTVGNSNTHTLVRIWPLTKCQNQRWALEIRFELVPCCLKLVTLSNHVRCLVSKWTRHNSWNGLYKWSGRLLNEVSGRRHGTYWKRYWTGNRWFGEYDNAAADETIDFWSK